MMRIAIALAIAIGVAACSDGSNGAGTGQHRRPLMPLAFDADTGTPRIMDMAGPHHVARSQG